MNQNEKRKLGQYFTKKDLWLKPQILHFIKNSNCTIAYDPFAGNGDLLKLSMDCGMGTSNRKTAKFHATRNINNC